ncbi:hypothetical protein ACI3KS_08410 [Microbacterium sp. ZW T5_45]|uniref:hypothetical protein n=1 Tax=Microbacterium sp. ZW T5_45 TaxID=3378080 RepID=UPI00385204D1
MEWMGDPSVGSWLVDRIDSFFGASMHGVVPRGYEAYARVFHPASVRSLPGGAVPTAHEWERMPAAEQQRLIDLFEEHPATWADVAAAFRTSLHPLAQWQSLVRTPAGEDWRTRLSPDGREFTSPDEGQLPAGLLAVVSGHLAAHTRTPDAGIAALWDGWGGLTGGLGHAPNTLSFGLGGDPHHEAMLGRSIHDPLNTAFRKPTWQEGILSREISEGPRLELPDRAHVLFAAAPREFADPGWVLRAPWRDLPAEAHGFAPSALSPSILWPEDRAWTLVTEVDFDSTVVAGTAALIAELCADDRLEALPIPADADLGWDADTINR